MAEVWKEGDKVETPNGQKLVLQGGQWVPLLVSGGGAAAISAFDTGVQNLANAPAATSDLLNSASVNVAAAGDAAVRSAGNLLSGEPAGFLDQFGVSKERFAKTADENRINPPRFGPELPENIRAGVMSLSPDMDFQEAQNLAGRQSIQGQEQFPASTLMGAFGADAATILASRRPIAKARGTQAAAGIKAQEELLKSSRRVVDELPPEVRNRFQDVFTGEVLPAFKNSADRLKNAGVKAAEAGFEGAFLAALNDGDPATTAALSAGSQVGQSLFLFLGEKAIRHPVITTIGTAWAISEMWKAAAPGDQSFFESKDFAVQKVTGAMLLGATAALMGGGRMRGKTAANYPIFADAVTSIPRTVMINRWEELTNNAQEGNETPGLVMEQMSRDPGFFNSNQLNSLNRAMNSEKKGAFTKEVERLMNASADFQKRISDLISSRTPPEGASRIVPPQLSGETLRGLETSF